ncbi:MAG: hypothetical protein QOD00_1519 [Blastocatellia bacterium]|nr:hypothetical protein [Blastocatellia bacterium]
MPVINIAQASADTRAVSPCGKTFRFACPLVIRKITFSLKSKMLNGLYFVPGGRTSGLPPLSMLRMPPWSRKKERRPVRP